MGRAEEVLKGLSSLREENMLCDVQLEAEGRQIAAHKAVLAAASPYFRAMFCGTFKETREQVVSIKEVPFLGLRSVVECIYSTEIGSLDEKNIEHVFPAAHLLQMKDILEECVKWMGQNLSEANCLTLLKMADKFSVAEVQDRVTKFILKNFVTVSELEDFNGISKQALVKYLSADTLKTKYSEYAVFKAARKWIMANEIPANEIPEIMSHIRFGLISPDVILNHISSDALIDDNKECRKMIADSMLYHTNVFSQPLYEGNLNKPRGEPGLVFMPSSRRMQGYHIADAYIDLHFISLPHENKSDSKVTWPTFRLETPVTFESMCAIGIRNFLYIFGVSDYGYQNFSKRYDASTDSWLEIAPLPRPPAVGASIAHAGEHIFVMGGMTVDGNSDYDLEHDEIIDDVFMYDISRNEWDESKPLPVALAYTAAAKLEGKAFVTGGETNTEVTSDQVWAFDSKAKVWLSKAQMNQARCQHVLEVVKDKLYALGGWLDHDDQYTSMIETYDPLADQWTVLLLEAVHTHCSSSFVNGDLIYIVGGNNNPFDEHIHCYDTVQNTLLRVASLPSDSQRNVSAFMVLPKLL